MAIARRCRTAGVLDGFLSMGAAVVMRASHRTLNSPSSISRPPISSTSRSRIMHSAITPATATSSPASTWIVDADERAPTCSDDEARTGRSAGLCNGYNAAGKRRRRAIDRGRRANTTSSAMAPSPSSKRQATRLAILCCWCACRMPAPVLLTGDMFHLAESRERRPGAELQHGPCANGHVAWTTVEAYRHREPARA